MVVSWVEGGKEGECVACMDGWMAVIIVVVTVVVLVRSLSMSVSGLLP